jgi:hypothetical protein
MFKKLVFVGAVLLIASASYAATPTSGFEAGVDVEEWDGNANIKGESWSWPAEYKYQPVCIIPVKMDVGFWVRVIGCKDCVIKLRQDAIRRYSGNLTLEVQCNVNIQLKVSFSKNSGMPSMDNSVSVNPSSLAAPGGSVVVALTLSNVDIKGFTTGIGTNIEVGKVTLSVRPDVVPALAGV